jgi:hypothetical protein
MIAYPVLVSAIVVMYPSFYKPSARAWIIGFTIHNFGIHIAWPFLDIVAPDPCVTDLRRWIGWCVCHHDCMAQAATKNQTVSLA